MSKMTKDEIQSGGTRFLGDIEHDKREWVGLTEDEAAELSELWERIDDRDSWELIMQVQAKLKEKNT